MHTKSSSELGEGLPQEERLRQLCQAIQALAFEAPREKAAFYPDSTLRAEAGLVLVPHLEAGLRALAGVLRDDLIVRIANVQQLERLSGIEADPCSISRMLRLGREEPETTSEPDSSAAPLHAENGSVPFPDSRSEAAEQEVVDLSLAPVDSEQALPLAQQRAPAPESDTRAAEDSLRLAADCWRRGAQEQALAACSRAIQLAPAIVSAYLLRGQMHCLRRDQDRAIEDFTSAIDLCPDHAEAFARRGNVYLERGLLRQAVQDYSAALDLEPGLTTAYLNRARAHARQKAWQEAIADARSVLRLQPRCVSAYFIRGSAWFHLGDPHKALDDLSRLLQIDPKHVLAYYERGLVYVSLGEYEQALEDYSTVLRFKPGFRPALYQRAIALFQQGEFDLALAAFTELIHAMPDNAMAYYQRGLVHRARCDRDRAVADFTRALELQPRFEQADNSLQQALRLSGSGPQQVPSQASVETTPDVEAPPGAEDEAATPLETPASSDYIPVKTQDEATAPVENEKTRPNFIRLTCKECGASSQVRFDRLDKTFQCRKCRCVYAVKHDGKLTEIVPARTVGAHLKAFAWQGLRLSPIAVLLLLLLVGGRYVWRGVHARRSFASLPQELEPRAELLVKAWLDRDAQLIQLLTTPTQEGQVHTWLKANPSPLSAEKGKVSKTALQQTKIGVEVQRETPNAAHLRILVSLPLGSPVRVEQRWVREGTVWFFQPFPETLSGR